MPTNRDHAAAEFKRVMAWILVISVAMVVAAIAFLAATGELTTHMVIATILGVFFSMLLGCGLFAAAFFSDKSGHDQSISDATGKRPDDEA